MKPKLLVESDKYFKQGFQGTVLFLCKFFSHTGLSLQWGSDTWAFGLVGVLAPLVGFQQSAVLCLEHNALSHLQNYDNLAY